jgi:hydroxymethylbilane synthase
MILPAKRDWLVATRKSPLALWQTKFVCESLKQIFPEQKISLLPLSTKGDEVLDRSLNKIGGKGLFIKELERALLSGDADFAVHSLKDVPVELSEQFTLAAILKREDPRDVFISMGRYVHPSQMPSGASIGTSSLRRVLQLKRQYPHLNFTPLRGNINTRIEKLKNGLFDAIVLAKAGVVRLGLENVIDHVFSIDELLPCAGQGALVIETSTACQRVGEEQSSSSLLRQLSVLQHQPTSICVTIERLVARALDGSCQVPLAVHAYTDSGMLYVKAVLGDLGERYIQAHVERPISMTSLEVTSPLLKEVAMEIISQLERQGAQDILKACVQSF